MAEVGAGTARVWRLYMAGSRLGFERNMIQLHQILGVKLGADGRVGDAAAPGLGGRRRPGRGLARAPGWCPRAMRWTLRAE